MAYEQFYRGSVCLYMHVHVCICKGIYFTTSLFTGLILIDFSLTVKEATLLFMSAPGSAISSAKQGKSGSLYNLVKN